MLSNSHILLILKRTRFLLVLQYLRKGLAKIGLDFTPYYWAKDLNQPNPIPAILGIQEDYTFHEFKKEDLIELAKNRRGYSSDTLLGKLNSGKICFGIKYKNKPIAFLWVDVEKCTFKAEQKKLKENEAYLSILYVNEDFRGKNIASHLHVLTCLNLNNKGIDTIYSVTEYFNYAARKFKNKLNIQNLQLYVYVNIFGQIKSKILLRNFQ